jgi:hypothetical protein
MYIDAVLLIAIAIILYSIYKKISKMLTLLENESRVLYPENDADNRFKVKDWLRLIYYRSNAAMYSLENIDYALNYDNPAGGNSAPAKRIRNLINLYAEYLIKTEQLSQSEAEARAVFEFSEFDIRELVKKINDSSSGRNWKKIGQFFVTGLLEKDCAIQAQTLIPHDIFAPIWDLFKKQMYVKNKECPVRIEAYENSYKDYVKNRSIVLKLLDLGIIAKVEPKRPDAYWLGDPTFRFRIDDLEEIRSIIYMGGSFHDDAFFESRYNEGSLDRVFRCSNFP